MPRHEHEMGTSEEFELHTCPDCKRDRMKALLDAGLSQADAELVDDEAFDVLKEIFALEQRRLVAFGEKLPQLGLAFGAHLAGIHAMFAEESRQALGRAILSKTMGFHVIEIKDPKDIDAFFRAIFGEGEGPGRG